MIAPRTAPPAPPIVASFVALLQPPFLVVSGMESVAGALEVDVPLPTVELSVLPVGLLLSLLCEGVGGVLTGVTSGVVFLYTGVWCCGTLTSLTIVTVFTGVC